MTKDSILFFFSTKATKIQLNKRKQYKEEKWDITQTFSKGCEPIVGHSQHIFNQFLPNNVWCILPPQKAIRPQT